MNKTVAKAPQWAVEKMKQRRSTCDECPSVPSWTNQRGAAPLPMGPEVSYGIPFRWSASRLLAADVKSHLCGSYHNDTSECKSLMNESAWGLQSFIDYFTGDMHKLFNVPTSITEPGLPGLLEATSDENDLDEDEMWDGDDAAWVACSQELDGKCFGGISRADWYSPRRGDVCVSTFTDEVRKGNVNESTVPLDICTLSSDLADMCQKLQSALLKVQTANCIAAGACATTQHVYAPGLY
jgi:hypothetical protein